MSKVTSFIDEQEDDQREVMFFLHRYLTEELELTDKMRYDIPFYYGRSWICYLNPTKNGAVEFAFIRGNELSNEQGLLDSRGRKQVYGVEFEKMEDIPFELLEEVIQEAILLDETVAYQSKRKSGK